MFGPWTFIAVWVGIPLLIAVVIVAIAVSDRRRGVRSTALSRADRVAAALVGTGAALVAGFDVFGMVAFAVSTFTLEPMRVTGFPLANASTPEFIDKSDAIVGGGYESVWLDVRHIPTDARWWLYLEGALPLVASLAISVVIVWLAVALLRSRPFARRLPLAIGFAAIAVMIGGMGSQVAGAIARGTIVEYLDPRVITAGDMGDGPYEGLMGFSLGLDPSPLGWALGLALVAAAFQIGTRLQRDTEGLV